MTIAKDILDSLRAKLKNDQQQITKELEEFAKRDSALKDDWDTVFPQFGTHTSEQDENAKETEQYGNLLSVEYTLELRLRDIKRALEKMDNGTYGICENCSSDIDLRRLRAKPEARFCLRCRTKEIK